jgi:hypothetical protein
MAKLGQSVNGFDRDTGALVIVEVAPVFDSVFHMQLIVDGRVTCVDFREFAKAYRNMMDAWGAHPEAVWRKP